MKTEPYSFLTIFGIAAVLFAAGPLILARVWAHFFSPAKPGKVKNATYECGLESKPQGWVQFRSDYYLYALVFLVFDVETIFLLPFAVAFQKLSAPQLLGMLLFILLLVEGLVWACVKGVLHWK